MRSGWPRKNGLKESRIGKVSNTCSREEEKEIVSIKNC